MVRDYPYKIDYEGSSPSLSTISCVVLENSSVHLENALALTSLSAGTRNIVLDNENG